MNSKFELFVESFDKLYDAGFRFIKSVDDFTIVEKKGHSEIHTSASHVNFLVDGERISDEHKERTLNFAAFLMANKNKKALK